VAIALAIEPDEPTGSSATPVTAAEATAIVQRRCVTCHSESPTSDQFRSAPAGVVLDTTEQMAERADQIRALAVDSRAMPLGNVTNMTEQERQALGAWIAAGAPVK
jgi:uncharacterized membrane protein